MEARLDAIANRIDNLERQLSRVREIFDREIFRVEAMLEREVDRLRREVQSARRDP